jgi:hypothetical protein
VDDGLHLFGAEELGTEHRSVSECSIRASQTRGRDDGDQLISPQVHSPLDFA